MAKKLGPIRNRGGRPAFQSTADQRRQVEQLVAVGTTEDDIAAFLRIATMTLRKHFSRELQFGRMTRRAEIVDLLFTSARAGNVSAQKKLEDMTGVAMMARPSAGIADRAPRLGKKEEQILAARNPDATTAIGELMAKRAAGPAKVH